jgi:hypothetical protein
MCSISVCWGVSHSTSRCDYPLKTEFKPDQCGIFSPACLAVPVVASMSHALGFSAIPNVGPADGCHYRRSGATPRRSSPGSQVLESTHRPAREGVQVTDLGPYEWMRLVMGNNEAEVVYAELCHGGSALGRATAGLVSYRAREYWPDFSPSPTGPHWLHAQSCSTTIHGSLLPSPSVRSRHCGVVHPSRRRISSKLRNCSTTTPDETRLRNAGSIQ